LQREKYKEFGEAGSSSSTRIRKMELFPQFIIQLNKQRRRKKESKVEEKERKSEEEEGEEDPNQMIVLAEEADFLPATDASINYSSSAAHSSTFDSKMFDCFSIFDQSVYLSQSPLILF
jgi:hypothetical protein